MEILTAQELNVAQTEEPIFEYGADGYVYQVMSDGTKVQRTTSIYMFEIILSEGMTVEEQVKLIAWKEEHKGDVNGI
jgi:hypothetical protein